MLFQFAFMMFAGSHFTESLVTARERTAEREIIQWNERVASPVYNINYIKVSSETTFDHWLIVVTLHRDDDCKLKVL
jgi:hypothetical protein